MEALNVLNQSFKAFLDQGDSRVKDWPLMQTPFPGMAMIIAYIYFVKVAGPQFMKKRQPHDLRALMAIYNFVLVFINLWVFLGIGWFGYFNGYSLKCQPVDYSNNYNAVKMAEFGYFFYLTKFIEFADTIFFVLRKKDNQISALHVIHHSIVPFSLWFGIKFAPGGYNAFFPFLNSFVHVVMYTYYGLAALGERYKKFLRWKKYMTYIQLSQFICVIIYAISLWYHQCENAKFFIVMNFVHAALFFGLFLNFFVKNYTKRPVSKSSPLLKPLEKSRFICEENKFGGGSNDPEIEQDGYVKRDGYVMKVMTQMNEEIENHLARLHSCASEVCCQLNCRSNRSSAHKGGKDYDYSSSNSVKSCSKVNSKSGSVLKEGKTFKVL